MTTAPDPKALLEETADEVQRLFLEELHQPEREPDDEAQRREEAEDEAEAAMLARQTRARSKK